MPYAALNELVALAGMDAPVESVAIAGNDPVLPTRYRVGTAGAAALAATGLAAWLLKTGRRQRVSVNLRAAAVSLRCNAYLRINGEKPSAPWDPLSGFYPAGKSGWIYLHCNFVNHRAAAFGVLGPSRKKPMSRRNVEAGPARRSRTRFTRRAAARVWFAGPTLGRVTRRRQRSRRCHWLRSPGSATPRHGHCQRVIGRSRACACSTLRACSKAPPALAFWPSTAPMS